MRVYYSPSSPFVRKVLVVAAELALSVEKAACACHPINRDRAIVGVNPLGQVPTLFTDDGSVLFDSRVICRYLNGLARGDLYPAEGPLLWAALTRESMANGMLDSALLIRVEKTIRPPELLWNNWIDSLMDKIVCSVDAFEQFSASLEQSVDIAAITIACALGYLDFRFPDFDWRANRPGLTRWASRFNERPSMKSTQHSVAK